MDVFETQENPADAAQGGTKETQLVVSKTTDIFTSALEKPEATDQLSNVKEAE